MGYGIAIPTLSANIMNYHQLSSIIINYHHQLSPSTQMGIIDFLQAFTAMLQRHQRFAAVLGCLRAAADTAAAAAAPKRHVPLRQSLGNGWVHSGFHGESMEKSMDLIIGLNSGEWFFFNLPKWYTIIRWLWLWNHGNWLVVWTIDCYFSIYWEFHHANWRTHILQGLKPPTRTNFHGNGITLDENGIVHAFYCG